MQRDGFVIDAAIAKGRKLPDWYLDAPQEDSDTDFYLRAFDDLNTCRTTIDPIGYIPWDKISEYGIFHGLDNDMLRSFITIIRVMDNAYIDWWIKQQQKQQKQIKARSRG